MKNDLGPHLKRLPEELLPAIGKFLIIAKDNYQNEVTIRLNLLFCQFYEIHFIFIFPFLLKQRPLSDSDLADTTLLIKCLIVMCRHFDNINTIANYEYISSTVAISMDIIIGVSFQQEQNNALNFNRHIGCDSNDKNDILSFSLYFLLFFT